MPRTEPWQPSRLAAVPVAAAAATAARRIARRIAHLGRRVGPHARERGALAVCLTLVRWLAAWARGRALVGRVAPGSFEVDGRTVRYVHHRYNRTWLNERAVEVALALEVLDERGGGEVLEVGNVLGHYGRRGHHVVDKYERGPDVDNEDVVGLPLDRTYDLVLSISTLEHVGLDEPVVDPAKVDVAVRRLRSVVRPGGLLWVTVPVGYNHHLDRALRAGDLGLEPVLALRRSSRANHWHQVDLHQVWDARYDRLLYTAHGLVVAVHHVPESATTGR